MASLPPVDIATYGRRLFQRRHSGVIVPPAEVSIGTWRPVEHECHVNVSTVCARDSTYLPVRGWLVFDFRYFIRFTAHSVVRFPSGIIYDITPSRTSMPYPFLPAEESEADYCALIDGMNTRHLDYDPDADATQLWSE